MGVGVRALVVAVAVAAACGGQSTVHRGGGDGDGPDVGDDDVTGDDDDIVVGGNSSGGSGNVPTGGLGALGGGAGRGGSAGMTSCAQSLDAFAPGCDAPGALRGYCAKAGCHNVSAYAARLDLTPDDFLVSRILDVPATFENITLETMGCLPPGCPAGGARLVDSSFPAESWMLRKMEPFIPGVTTTTIDMGCGDAMPTFNTTNTANYTEDMKTCLVQFFTDIARYGIPCAPSGAGEAIPRPPPCP